MDKRNFDAWTRQLAISLDRREFRRRLAGGALAVLLVRLGRKAAAAQEAAANRCSKDGDECKRGNQCCSGVCKQRKCRRSPDQGSCTIRKGLCRNGTAESFCDADDVGSCACHVRLNGAAFCGGTAECFACQSNDDCVAEFGAGFVCARGGRFCCPNGEPSTVCVSPCANPA